MAINQNDVRALAVPLTDSIIFTVFDDEGLLHVILIKPVTLLGDGHVIAFCGSGHALQEEPSAIFNQAPGCFSGISIFMLTTPAIVLGKILSVNPELLIDNLEGLSINGSAHPRLKV